MADDTTAQGIVFEQSLGSYPPTVARALKLYFFAQTLYPEQAAWFTTELVQRSKDIGKTIPWLLDDRDFQIALEVFARRFDEFLAATPEEQQRVDRVVPQEVVTTTIEELSTIPAKQQRAFIEKLTKNYIKQLKKNGVSFADEQKEVAFYQAVSQQYTEAAKEEKTFDAFTTHVQSKLETIQDSTGKNISRESFQVITKEARQDFLNTEELNRKKQETTYAVFSERVQRPDVFAKILTEKSIDRPRIPFRRQVEEAARLAQTTEVLTADFLPIKESLIPTLHPLAKTGFQKAAAVIADTALQIVPLETRWQIVDSVIAKSFNRVITDTNTLTARFGEEFVSSDMFDYLYDQGKRTFVDKSSQIRAGSAVAGTVNDIVGTFFKAGTMDDTILHAIELNRLGVFSPDFGPNKPGQRPGSLHKTPPGMSDSAFLQSLLFPGDGVRFHNIYFTWESRGLYLAAGHQANPSSSLLENAGGWVFHWGAKKGGQKIATEVGKKVAVTGVGKWLGGVLGTVFGPGIGTFLGIILGDLILDKAINLAVGLGKGVINAVSLGWLRDMMEGRFTAPSIFSFEFWFAAVPLIVIILISGIIPLPFDTNFTGHSSRSSALALGGGGPEEGPPPCDSATDPNCAVSYCDPAKQDCSWPTSCGCITQGPRNSAGETHHSLNAVDVGVRTCGSHIDVRATHAGVVTEVFNGYGENHFAKNYGNVVKLEGKDTKGTVYTTIYAHLLTVAINPQTGTIIKVGDKLDKGAPIGKTDNNGYSFGEHLHYEYRGGGDISTILPTPVPHCDFGECPSICWK